MDDARGVATKYLNRYNALFALAFGKGEAAINKIYDLMTSRNGAFATISTVKSEHLLDI